MSLDSSLGASGLAPRSHVLVHGLGALGDGVLGELARQEEPHGGLDVARVELQAPGSPLELRGLERDPLEHVDAHAVQDLKNDRKFRH